MGFWKDLFGYQGYDTGDIFAQLARSFGQGYEGGWAGIPAAIGSKFQNNQSLIDQRELREFEEKQREEMIRQWEMRRLEDERKQQEWARADEEQQMLDYVQGLKDTYAGSQMDQAMFEAGELEGPFRPAEETPWGRIQAAEAEKALAAVMDEYEKKRNFDEQLANQALLDREAREERELQDRLRGFADLSPEEMQDPQLMARAGVDPTVFGRFIPDDRTTTFTPEMIAIAAQGIVQSDPRISFEDAYDQVARQAALGAKPTSIASTLGRPFVPDEEDLPIKTNTDLFPGSTVEVSDGLGTVMTISPKMATQLRDKGMLQRMDKRWKDRLEMNADEVPDVEWIIPSTWNAADNAWSELFTPTAEQAPPPVASIDPEVSGGRGHAITVMENILNNAPEQERVEKGPLDDNPQLRSVVELGAEDLLKTTPSGVPNSRLISDAREQGMPENMIAHLRWYLDLHRPGM